MGRKPMSPQAVLAFLVVLAAISWGVVALELALTRQVSVIAVANAAVFTVTLALWPLIAGARVAGRTMRIPDPCYECGALMVPAIRFCIRCGAYPKARAQQV